VTTTATTNRSGWTKWSGIPNKKRPHSSAETTEYKPSVELASVNGKRTRINRAGAATSGSNVPSQRAKVIAPPEPKSVDVQIPIKPALSAA
jgi:hypothetical protein